MPEASPDVTGQISETDTQVEELLKAGQASIPQEPDQAHFQFEAAVEIDPENEAAAWFQTQLTALDASDPGATIGVTEENHILLRAVLLNNLAMALILSLDDTPPTRRR
jgi:hypothetical protein